LCQGFASGEGHPAFGLFVKDPVSSDFRKYLFDGQLPTDHLQRFSGTGRGTISTNLASGAVNLDFIIVTPQRLGGTHLQTFVTQNAAGWPEDELRLVGAALRVMAPAAGQRTALEKNCRTNAGTVVDGISADVKNCTGDQDPTFLSK
jgi:hypothetical protein